MLYIDEAYELSSVSGLSTFSDAFLSAFADLYSGLPIFLVSLSTHPRMAELARRQTSAWGMRSHHQDPYTEPVFDCLPNNGPIFFANTMSLRDVAEPSFLVKFGRPLYVPSPHQTSG